MITNIKASDYKYRDASLQAASYIRSIEVLPAISSLLEHPDPRVRSEALDALAGYEYDTELANRLWKLFQNDQDEEVKYIAASSLGVWKDERILPYLLSLLKENDDEIRATVCSILRRYRLPRVADRLLEVALNDSNINTRVMATFALADFGDPRVVEPCLQLLNSSDDYARIVMAYAVITFPHKSLFKPEVTDVFANWINTNHIKLRILGRAGLIALRDPRCYPGLWSDVSYSVSGKVGNHRWSVISQLAQWVPPEFDPVHLRSLLHDREPVMRANAALVAGQERANSLIPDLESLLEDHSVVNTAIEKKTVSEYASEALDRIAGKRERWQPSPRKGILSNIR